MDPVSGRLETNDRIFKARIINSNKNKKNTDAEHFEQQQKRRTNFGIKTGKQYNLRRASQLEMGTKKLETWAPS